MRYIALARTRTQLEESLGAMDVELTRQDIERIEQAIPADAVAGTRHHADHMRMSDSEK